MENIDVIILGGGPGGIACARELAAGGKKVCLVEDGQWGGVCLNCGCIPTKMLLAACEPQTLLQAQERQRVLKGQIQVDYPALRTRITRFTRGTSQTAAKNLAAMGVVTVTGRGRLVGQGRVEVQTADGLQTLEAAQIVLATGSSNRVFPNLAPDGQCVLDSTGLLAVESVPESLIVVGAGAIGLELGEFFASQGSKVTIVEAAPHIAPLEDEDIAAELRKTLAKKGRTIIEGVGATSLVSRDGQAVLTLADGRELGASLALVAVGRTPNSDLGGESCGVSLDRRGFIETNDQLEAAPGVYAIGDVNGRVLLAHAAEHQGSYVARRILGEESGPYVSGPVPSCYYGLEIMRVGATAQELVRAGRKVQVSKVPLTLNPIAQASGLAGGFVKAVWCDGRLVGMAAIGHGVSHLVTVAQLLVANGATAENLHTIMFAHPTLDEIVPMAIRARKEDVPA